ncbi:MAG: aromatic ring-hydroxylating dioxygenase subunit alpha [Phycisphaerae bacterium]|nr:aromatic ring-hydroxylating dioxygenase subunit alpha [Phycisphaerae bacterium]NUQ46152.1 aromatic ring-hydroxylating dioxygenase subunit alpha [Phycisphaerae bacterium]
MNRLAELLNAYDPHKPLADAATIPSGWYTDSSVADLERRAVFSAAWQMIGRVDDVREPGQFITAEIAGEPVAVVRGRDGVLRGFFNVCRHHAAAVLTQACGTASLLRCPYHGWTYTLEGALKGAPEFEEVRGFERSDNGLVPLAIDTWEPFVFVRLDARGPTLADCVGDLAPRVAKLNLPELRFVARRAYEVGCNWKVYVDNYLDGGYHVPHAHKSLGSVLDYQAYSIENGPRFCQQSSPIEPGGDAATAAVRGGRMAYYYWLYPNFMLNWYEGVMDTNLVVPRGVDRCEVVFDYYFAAAAAADESRIRQSIAVSERVQEEDRLVCESVQRGLRSRAYDVGRLSVRREAGEHLFHRLLHADLTAGLRAEDVIPW